MKKVITSFLIFTWALLSAAQASTTINPKNVSISNLPGFMTVKDLEWAAAAEGDAPLFRCAEIEELRGAFLCFSRDRLEMNQALVRAGIFWGTAKGFARGALVSQEDESFASLKGLVHGHNLPGDVVSDFFNAAYASQDIKKKPNAFEEEFYRNFVSSPRISGLGNKYYLINISILEENSSRMISHEYRHARLYLDPEIKSVIQKFWLSEVTEKDRGQIRKALSDVYNVENEAVMIDEFQAYVLESGAKNGLLAPFAVKYEARLRLALKSIKK